MNPEQDKLNDNMIHALGRIAHLEAQVESLARSVWILQERVDRVSKGDPAVITYADGSKTIHAGGSTIIVDAPAPYGKGVQA
jgi:hypothetical protein